MSVSLSQFNYKKAGLVAIFLAVFGAVGALLSWSLPDAKDKGPDFPTFVAKRGPLNISVLESGTIAAREQIILKSEVEGRTSILKLVPEGAYVQEGELLVELDASSLVDNRIEQEIKLQNAEASYIGASENFEVEKNQAQSDVAQAELDLDFAKQDLQKYTEGEYPNELKKAESEITLAEEELTRSQETVKWSKQLYEQKYLSLTELQADELTAKRNGLQLDLAKNNLSLLTDFTYRRTLAQLESDVKQADMALERVTRKVRANVIAAEADLKAKEAEFKQQKDKLTKIVDQIEKTKIYAPANGLVIYATSAQSGGFHSNVEPLDEGQEVRERQELIYLPTANSSKAVVGIHEASLQKVRKGLPAIIKLDALPGKTYIGSIAKIAPLPDAQSMWMNPGLKIYNSEIFLDSDDPALRTGMTCQVEIMVEQYDEAVYVPVQAVVRVNGQPTVYVLNNETLKPQAVEIGLDNNTMVHVISGIKEGEIVSLAPPLGSTATSGMFDGMKAAGGSENDADIATQVATQLNGLAKGDEKSQVNDSDNAERGGKKRDRDSNMSDEQKQRMRERFENMTDEEKEQMRKRVENMSDEQRQKLSDDMSK